MKTLIFGLAIGAAVGYLLATEDKDEIIEGAKNAIREGKDYLNDGLQKGKKVMSNARDQVADEMTSR